MALSGIRPFAPADASDVAGLFRRVFMRERHVNIDALARCFQDIFLTTTYGSLANGSLVFAEAGRITGFVGVVPTLFHVGEQSVRVAMVGSLMVEDPRSNPLTGARLVRAVATGGYDIVLSETANAVSRRMWDTIGSRSVPGYSLDYIKILHPARFALDVARRRYAIAHVARPFAHAIDLLAAPLRQASVTLDAAYGEADIGADETADLILRLTAGRTMRPAFDGAALARRIEHGSVKRGYGDYVARAVTHRGVPVGLYIYHVYAGRFAYVRQLLAEPKHMMETATRLIEDARARGAVAVKGRAEPANMTALGLHQCFFSQRASTIVHTTRPDLLSPLLSGDAFVTGVAGETWMQLIGHSFPPAVKQ
ncbi:hypothetical protein GCM10007276_03760 [Agaricicola taiwanensis]|uniref:Uncharacterized protein n=2 Tax=Agaricicola taiwanensis TaxID=591372 RepID=A0A8J2VK97_9RHOB|nr:hypothetical protein GCM10007276_03760 [Agaricicola taiwanensis]